MKYLKKTLVASLMLASLSACTTTVNPSYGESRSQFMLISSEDINKIQAEAYEEDKKKAGTNLNKDVKLTQRVKKLSEKLIDVAIKVRPDTKDWQWEVNTITDNTVNAYCRSGGKIIVYTGLNDALKLTDDELAFIIAHEISHALKEHSRESVSQTMVASGVSKATALLGYDNYANIASIASNVGILLPYSREMEYEADNLGLELSYKAGFDPQAALSVTQKLKALDDKYNSKNNSGTISSFANSITSTHPASEDRLTALEDTIKKYNLTKKSN